MSLSKYFDQCPPYPSDVPTADLLNVSLGRLEGASEAEASTLFDACRVHGFFLLDLRDSKLGNSLLKDAETMFDITAETLSLEKSILNSYAYQPPKDLLGYKAPGKLKTDDGKLDATEMYTLGQDDVLGTALPRRNPEPIESRRETCHSFLQNAYSAVAVVIGTLDTLLGLPKGTLADLSSLGKASATSLRLLLTRPQQSIDPKRVTLGAHTDIGLITLLINVAGGLQILPAESENSDGNWRYIRPERGCALINLGDTLVQWTGGLLRSSLHRVVVPPGRQNTVTRISLAYLVRPAHGESMKRLAGKAIPQLAEGEKEDDRTVDEWAAERAMQIISGILKPRTTGGGIGKVH